MENTFLLSQDGLEIFTKLSEPGFGEIRRIVLGVHGLGGSTNDEIQMGIAEEMAMFGAATLRFDFPAHGSSPMACEDLTLTNCVKSLLAVARYAREQYPDVEDLCIFATGFGAYVTLVALEDLLTLPGKVKLVVQTPSVLMHETLLAMIHMTEPTMRAMGKFINPKARPRELYYGFFEELRDNIVLDTQPVPMLILHGEADSVIKQEHIRHFRRINPDSKLVIIPGTSHRFLEDGAWDMVLDLTRDWFEFEQVLCCDWE